MTKPFPEPFDWLKHFFLNCNRQFKDATLNIFYVAHEHKMGLFLWLHLYVCYGLVIAVNNRGVFTFVAAMEQQHGTKTRKYEIKGPCLGLLRPNYTISENTQKLPHMVFLTGQSALLMATVLCFFIGRSEFQINQMANLSFWSKLSTLWLITNHWQTGSFSTSSVCTHTK